MIAVVIKTEETEKPCPCLSAAEAREMTASKNSEVCRRIMTRVDEAVRDRANRGTNCVQVLFAYEAMQARLFAKQWLEELGYTVEFHPSAMYVKW